MPLELYVSRRAAREIERVVQWWAVNRPSTPGAVRQDLQAALNLLLVQPGIGVRVNQASSQDVRRLHLDRIQNGAACLCISLLSGAPLCAAQVTLALRVMALPRSS